MQAQTERWNFLRAHDTAGVTRGTVLSVRLRDELVVCVHRSSDGAFLAHTTVTVGWISWNACVCATAGVCYLRLRWPGYRLSRSERSVLKSMWDKHDMIEACTIHG